jgi:hypothetical protein
MEHGRFNKEHIEHKLNHDEEFRQRFLESPADVLRSEGLDLSDENAAKLQQQLSDTRGQDLPSGASVAANGVMISISKSF